MIIDIFAFSALTLLVGRQEKYHTHTHPFNSSLSGTTRVSQYQKGKTNLDFTGARDNEWQTDNHASTPPLSFFQARCPSCHPTNSVKALKAEKASGL